MIARLIGICFFILLVVKLSANPIDSTKRSTFFPLPIVFFSPETNWGFGAAGIYSFYFPQDSLNSRPSQLQLGFAYTLRDQILAYLPFQLFIKNGRYKVYGELGYYRYVYEFSGIGNKGFLEDSELFNANFPRLRLNALYQFRKDLFFGIRYWMDDYDIVEVEAGGLLDTEDITGSAGGFLSGLGVVFNKDTRDQIFYPSQGQFTEVVAFFNRKLLGSDFNFSKFIVDHSQYFSTSWEHIFAINAYVELTNGNPPFNQLSLLGGPKKMRGYFEGALRDRQFLTFQGEYRMPLFWRFGLVGFIGAGVVGETINSIETNDIRLSYGLGLRFLLDQKQKVNIRMDAGFGKNTSGMYITVSEAF